VWGNVITAAFSTEEGAFLRGQVTMEEQVDIGGEISSEDEERGKSSQEPEVTD
jgi:hypothetical protein